MKFILVRPAYSSNLGATARAMTTMGFSELVLVQPKADPNSERARALAKHAHEVLDNIKIFPTLKLAIEDCDLVVAASHRQRRIERTVIKSNQLSSWVKDKGRKTAIVFGTESTGLSIAELGHCDAIVTIPAACSQPSLNLAQAVMILAYELSDKTGLPKPAYLRKNEDRPLRESEYFVLKKRLLKTLEQLGVQPDRYLSKMGNIETNDMFLLHDVLSKVEKLTHKSDEHTS